MDRDPAFAEGCHSCDIGGDAAWDRRGVAVGAARFLGQTGRRCGYPSAAGAAAGCHRLSAAADLRPGRHGRRVARGPSRHRVRLSLDRGGNGLRHHVVSAGVAADPTVDRSSRPSAGGGFDCDRDEHHDRLRMVRPPRHKTPAWKLTMRPVDISKQLGEFSIKAAFTSEGRVTGLFGASGAGKTSLVNMIAGLLRPDRGVIALDGETLDDAAAGVHVPPHYRRIGYVFQDARLFPHLNVRQNLDYGRRMNRLAY